MGGGTALGLATAYGRCQMRILMLDLRLPKSLRVVIGSRDESLAAEGQRCNIALMPVEHDERLHLAVSPVLLPLPQALVEAKPVAVVGEVVIAKIDRPVPGRLEILAELLPDDRTRAENAEAAGDLEVSQHLKQIQTFQTYQSKVQNILPIQVPHHVEDVCIVESP